jgi:hypothetical protein
MDPNGNYTVQSSALAWIFGKVICACAHACRPSPPRAFRNIQHGGILGKGWSGWTKDENVISKSSYE